MSQYDKEALDAWLATSIATGALAFRADVNGDEPSTAAAKPASAGARAPVKTNLETLSDYERKLKDLRAEEQMIWARADAETAGKPTGEQLVRLDAI